MEHKHEIGSVIKVNQKVIDALEKLRNSGATGPDLALSLRDIDDTNIEYAEVALRQIGFTTKRTEDEPNKLRVFVSRGDSYVDNPRSEIIDWEENS